MSCYTTKIDLPCHRLGDVYLGLGGFGPVTIVPAGATEPVAPTSPLTRVRMQFRRRDKVYTLDSDPTTNPDYLITITDADTWTVEVGSIAKFLPSRGAWKWDAEFTSDYFGGALTLYHGTLTVVQDISQ